MANLSAVPGVVDLECYSGDTFTFSVTAPASLVDGMEWLGQVRSAKDGTIDAEFTITPPTEPDGPAYVTLWSADTTRLCADAPLVKVTRRRGRSLPTPLLVQQYQGVWDVQVSAPGGIDPVTTLAAGLFTCELDVSRSEP